MPAVCRGGSSDRNIGVPTVWLGFFSGMPCLRLTQDLSIFPLLQPSSFTLPLAQPLSFPPRAWSHTIPLPMEWLERPFLLSHVPMASAPKRGAGPQKAEPRLCPGPRPTLCFCHRPGLSERDHHRNRQDQQPGRTVLLSEYPRGPQALQGQIPYNSRERGSPEGRRRLWGRAAWRAFCNYFPWKSPDV